MSVLNCTELLNFCPASTNLNQISHYQNIFSPVRERISRDLIHRLYKSPKTNVFSTSVFTSQQAKKPHGGGPSSRGVSIRRDGRGNPRALRRGCRETSPPFLPRAIQISVLACPQRRPTRRLPRITLLSAADISDRVGHTLEWGRPKLGSSRQDHRIDQVSTIINQLWLILVISSVVVRIV